MGVACAAVRRRRIKATCGAHVESQTRVCLACVCIPGDKRGRSPKGTAARVSGDATINSRGVRDGEKDAEKGKSPGTAAGGKEEEAAAHNPRRRHTQKRPRARGGGGGVAGPGAHCFQPAAHTRAKPLTHPASTRPRHTRHTPVTHPADTPPTHPPHARHTPATHSPDTPSQHTPDTPGTHPPSRAPDTPRPPPVRDRAERGLCGTGLSGV